MRINLIENEIPDASCAYDTFHCFYYKAEVRESGAEQLPWLTLREDVRIYFNDNAGVTFDVICNGAGVISSIAFRQKLVPGEYDPEFDHLLPVPAKRLLGAVAHPDIEQYEIESIRPLHLKSAKYGDVILVMMDAILPKNWYPISGSAFVGADEENIATAFLFFNIDFTPPE